MADPNGTWKASAADPRLLVARDPAEEGDGPYYRVLREGEIQGYDGVSIPKAPSLAGLDLNRNYPVDWRPPGDQERAGPYLTSEPEVRSVVQGHLRPAHICAFIQYHTYSGVQLRPYGDKPDDDLPTFDLRTFKEIGAKATELTGPRPSGWRRGTELMVTARHQRAGVVRASVTLGSPPGPVRTA